MRKISLFLSVSALSLAAAVPAQAGWYAGADAGVNIMQDESISGVDNSDGSTWTDTSKNSTGYGLQMQGGYNFGGPKAELELGYRSNSLSSLKNGGGNSSGDTTSLSVMANGIYQFLPKSKWHPFVGAGIGMAQIGADWSQGGRKVLDDSDLVFAYQGIAGIAYDLNKHWELKTQYRYFATQDATLTDTDGGSVKTGYHSHSILAGFTYKFGK